MIAIDTNVLIYSIDRHDPIKRSKARALLRQLRARSGDVVIPWQVVGEFLRFLRSLQDRGQLTRAGLEGTFRGYRRLFPIPLPSLVILDHAIALTARHSLSHWDSMLLGACLDSGVDTLYTEDMGAPLVIDGIALVNPFV
jgi:predicted nucleic acid-binding protein